MAKRHNERDGVQDDPTSNHATQDHPTDAPQDAPADDGPTQDDSTSGESSNGESTSEGHEITRRTFARAVGAAVTLGGGVGALGNAAAASLDTYLDSDGDVTIPAGEYSWSGSDLAVGSGDALIGEGDAGDVVWNLDDGTMDGRVSGRLENVVVRGSNHDAKAGIDVAPGAILDGFIWPEGGQESEDRALYTPNGGNDRLTIRNSAWGWMVNNGAYVDKPPVTMENCAAVNNNIANVRVGHRDGTDESETTYVRNTLIAVTEDILNDDTNSPNSRGLRLRSPANLVVENCWFVYLDVSGTADLIELHDGAAGSTVTIRDCAFYNDSNGQLVRDKSGGEMDVTIENCTVTGSGNREIEPDYSGSGVTEDDSVTFPLPSDVTGYPVADGIDGVGDGIGPWNGETTESTNDHTIVLHASPDNDSAIDVSFTVDGDLEYAAEAESDTDTIVTNDDGTMTATSVQLNPDALDSYRYTGDVVDYSVPDGSDVDVSVDGTTTTFEDLVVESSEEADVLEVIARQSGELNYEFTVDGSVELHETTETVTAGHGDEITDNGDGTVTVTGFTGNDGYGDAYLVSGTILSFTHDPEDYDFDVVLNDETVDPDTFGEEGNADVLEVIARQSGELNYEFTVDGSVELHETTETVTAGHGDEITDNGDGTVTVTGFTGNDGYGDAYLVSGTILSFTHDPEDYDFDVVLNDETVDPDTFGEEEASTDVSTSSDDDSSGGSNDDDLPHLLTIDGNDDDDVTTYTFTVSGDVVRDETLSAGSETGSDWHLVEDFAKNGKVIGLVGGGIDAYRFSGEITDSNINGDADVTVDWNA